MKQVQHVLTLPPLPSRPEEGHKGTFGHVLILAGSRGMSGAAVLCGVSALRGGAGLVTVGVPSGIQTVVSAAEPSYLTMVLPEGAGGGVEASARGVLEGVLTRYRGVGVGPGWGQSEATGELARWLFASCPVPLVVDADALNVLGVKLPERSEVAPRIMTPHPGEFGRLTGKTTQEIQADREELAVEYARANRVVLLLKGARTIVTDGERLAINTTGNCGMGTGGCGDVLTGLITALVGQGMGAFEAAQLGAHLHGLAGDLAAHELSKPGLIASDLPRYLCRAWLQVGAN
ncbi:MAG: NAD(P)H-hydrate dehydratase [Planctomycetaceae bacterium]|nr:NAD(P)H-hydrate dehydratase [Planctomycetaceae bacterium]